MPQPDAPPCPAKTMTTFTLALTWKYSAQYLTANEVYLRIKPSLDLPIYFHYSPRKRLQRVSGSKKEQSKVYYDQTGVVVPFRAAISCWMDLNVMTGWWSSSGVSAHRLTVSVCPRAPAARWQSSLSLCLFLQSFGLRSCGRPVVLFLLFLTLIWSHTHSFSPCAGICPCAAHPFYQTHPWTASILPEPILAFKFMKARPIPALLHAYISDQNYEQQAVWTEKDLHNTYKT